MSKVKLTQDYNGLPLRESAVLDISGAQANPAHKYYALMLSVKQVGGQATGRVRCEDWMATRLVSLGHFQSVEIRRLSARAFSFDGIDPSGHQLKGGVEI